MRFPGGLITHAAVRPGIPPGDPVPTDPGQQEVDGVLSGGGRELQQHEDVRE